MGPVEHELEAGGSDLPCTVAPSLTTLWHSPGRCCARSWRSDHASDPARAHARMPSCTRRNCATPRYPSPKPDPQAYLRKGEGDFVKARGPAAAAAASPSPPRAGAAAPRDNPPNTAFRRFYERGDLPISVDHKSFKNAIKWKVGRQRGSGALGRWGERRGWSRQSHGERSAAP